MDANVVANAINLKTLIFAFIAAMGIPSAVTGLAIWWFKKQLDKREARAEEKEKNTEQMILLIAQNSRATYTLAEATAKAVQRIPDAKCNGDMTEALAAAKDLQKEEYNFLIDQGIKRVFGESS